ncbi:MAG: SpoIVB peptidase S55 domain-containing protein [bacterium]
MSQIQTGMRGFGKTVFTGMEIEEFQFEVLDIMPNFRAKRDLILVRLLGEKVEHTGVVAGMSGSPMYIDGKLIGALAFSFGLFSKEPIAGVTPIEQMREILDRERVRSQELAIRQGFNHNYLEVAVGAQKFDWDVFIPPHFETLRSNRSVTTQFYPLETPLLFSGFQGASLALSERMFGGLGFKVIHSGGSFSTSLPMSDAPLEPGAAFSVVIVDGDIGLQATGTVTYRDGDHVFGFGHPFLNFGAVTLPMAKTKILTTLSSFMSSFKMSALTEIVGTLHQDRSTGVMGVSGEEAHMIPFHLTFRSHFQDESEFNFRIAEDRSLHSLTPLVFTIVLNSAIESARLSRGNQTLKLDGEIKLEGHDPIHLQNYYAGSAMSFTSDASLASGEIAATVGAILSNNFEIPKIERVDLNFEVRHKSFIGQVLSIEVSKTTVSPGDEIRIAVQIKEFQGQKHIVRHTLTIPDEIEARRIALYVGSGSLLTQLEVRTSPQKYRPKKFKQLVELLEKRRKNNFLFFQIKRRDKGVLVQGEALPGLPPSILTIMNSQKSTGNVIALRYRVLKEESVPVDYAISGGRTIWLRVKPKDNE